MSFMSASFKSEKAPCGRIVEGKRYEDRDQECLLTEDVHYACGCHSIQHEYHDGSISRKVVRHDGTILVDELLGAQ
ncbi:MAG: hypothetical protein HYX74_02760 [Acidobacteria bacterium]|nr:hypothetical protein [Acidobacteriota bacterium]